MPNKNKESSEKSKRGKKSRAKGQRFETKVRSDLENLGWVVSKWMNTVDYDREGKIGKLVPAKRKYNPFLKALSIGTGFPDFVCFKKEGDGFDVIGLEVKGNGYLDQIEKGMCKWLLDNKVFSRILIKSFAFDVEVLAVAYSRGYKKIYESPIKLNFSGISSINSLNFWKVIFLMMWDTVTVFYRLKILHYYDKK